LTGAFAASDNQEVIDRHREGKLTEKSKWL
jgi:hypothetical protein